MAHLIDKDALVAWAKETYLCENASMIRKVCYKQLLEHLDTTEVKEVDLEEAAIQFATDAETGNVDIVKQSSFFWGAIYHKQQMLNKAIDAEILEVSDNDYSICEHTHLELFVEPSTLEKKGFKENDKVKVIVIKED